VFAGNESLELLGQERIYELAFSKKSSGSMSIAGTHHPRRTPALERYGVSRGLPL
jgi:hypothetical protein